MQKRIVEYKLDLIQKLHLSFILLVILGVSLLLINKDFSYKYLLYFLTPIISILILSIIFLKSGLLIIDNTIYKGYFLLGLLIYKQKVNINNQPIVSILRLKRAHGMPAFGLASPQGVHSFYKFYIYLLNQSHTEKTEVIGFKKKENAEKVIDFLIENLNLTNEIYCPDFS
ncbi:hypothetical protein [Hanstruepera ponticola]|uniref:hypothetical protein n=1 Tax=Hanstruepera ponticola TaxID=2042995 RepID=UPI000CF0BB4B|nr:hypothetical protein [Hanstruepera ponticola]